MEQGGVISGAVYSIDRHALPAAGCARIAAAGGDRDNWLDTGGRHRGFVVVRWLDNPEPPAVTTRVLSLAEVGR